VVGLGVLNYNFTIHAMPKLTKLQIKTEEQNKAEALKFITNYPNISDNLKSIFQSIIDRVI